MTSVLSKSDLIGATTTLRAALERADVAAQSEIPVSLWGEVGVGKETFARLIATTPVVKLDCARLSARRWNALLAENELSALVADALGTLYLTNVETIPKPIQRRLARAIRDERVKARFLLGSSKPYLESRENELWDSEFDAILQSYPIKAPALRERTTDFAELAQAFFREAQSEIGAYPRSLTNKELSALNDLDYPENLDDLRRRVAYVAENDAVPQQVVTPVVLSVAAPQPTPNRAEKPVDRDAPFQSLDAAIIAHIEEALQLSGGIVDGEKGAAELLDVNPHTLRSKMRKFKINVKKFRD